MKNPIPYTLHANMLLIANLGVLVLGKPKIGKSELSLALLDRGHQLISDDATELFTKEKQLYAQCPVKLRNYLHTNALGLIQIDRIFPRHTIPHHPQQVDLILEIKPACDIPMPSDPFKPVTITKEILGKALPTFVLPSTTPVMLALLVEILVKNQPLRSTPCNDTV